MHLNYSITCTVIYVPVYLKKKHVLSVSELSKFLIYLIIPMRILDSTCTCMLYEENRIL